jgi:hypothetical protein
LALAGLALLAVLPHYLVQYLQLVVGVVVIIHQLPKMEIMVVLAVAAQLVQHLALLELVAQEMQVLIHQLKVMLVEMEGTSAVLIFKAAAVAVHRALVAASIQLATLAQVELELPIQLQVHL